MNNLKSINTAIFQGKVFNSGDYLYCIHSEANMEIISINQCPKNGVYITVIGYSAPLRSTYFDIFRSTKSTIFYARNTNKTVSKVGDLVVTDPESISKHQGK